MKAYVVGFKKFEHCQAVIAKTQDEAKKLGYAHITKGVKKVKPEFEWSEIVVECVPAADVKGLEVGILKDDVDGLKRGIYDFVETAICPICETEQTLMCQDGRIGCDCCLNASYIG